VYAGVGEGVGFGAGVGVGFFGVGSVFTAVFPLVEVFVVEEYMAIVAEPCTSLDEVALGKKATEIGADVEAIAPFKVGVRVSDVCVPTVYAEPHGIVLFAFFICKPLLHW